MLLLRPIALIHALFARIAWFYASLRIALVTGIVGSEGEEQQNELTPRWKGVRKVYVGVMELFDDGDCWHHSLVDADPICAVEFWGAGVASNINCNRDTDNRNESDVFIFKKYNYCVHKDVMTLNNYDECVFISHCSYGHLRISVRVALLGQTRIYTNASIFLEWPTLKLRNRRKL